MTAQNSKYKSISQLTQEIRDTLEGDFSQVTVCGEVSGFSAAHSGHWYLSLKDKDAQISAVVWRNTAQRIRFPMEDGLQVVVRGRISVYPPRGSYQLAIEQIEPLGEGSWRAAFRKLHEKLKSEGLFDPARKQTIPAIPNRVVVITSPTGAAIRDFLQVATRRWQGSDILILPTRVQGEGAGKQLAAAVNLASRIRPKADVIVLTRGGGSIEDLWEFNSEELVRAMAQCPIPIVSGVGHEIDVTLCDLAADLRALTPSEAAERIFPDAAGLWQTLKTQETRLVQAITGQWKQAKSRVDQLAQSRAMTQPLDRIHSHAQRLDELSHRLLDRTNDHLHNKRNHLQSMAARLEALSPLQVLSRGYSLTFNQSGEPLTHCLTLSPGDQIETRLNAGRVISQVLSTDNLNS